MPLLYIISCQSLCYENLKLQEICIEKRILKDVYFID